MTEHQQMPSLPPEKARIRFPGDRRIQQAAESISAALGANRTVREELRRLLAAVGRLPSNVRGRSDHHDGAVADAALRKLLNMLRPLLEVILPQTVEDDQACLAGIRRFFLEPQNAYSLDELTALWRVGGRDARDVFSDELAEWLETNSSAEDAFKVLRTDALRASITYNCFRPVDIERAVGADFGRVRPESWRTVPLLIHVPRFMLDALTFDGMMSPSMRTPSARLEQYLFDLFADEHRKAFAVALQHPGRKP